MWKMSKRLAVCVFAAAWWGIFYPELCFSEDTCAAVRMENAEEAGTQRRTEGAQNRDGETQSGKVRGRNRNEGQQSGSEEINAADVWRASGDEIVIGSRFWEWCEENLFDAPENAVQSASGSPEKGVSTGR